MRATAITFLLAVLLAPMSLERPAARFQIRLIRGTEEPATMDRSVMDAGTRRLLDSAFRWKYYYEDSVECVTVMSGAVARIPLGGDRVLEIRYAGDGVSEFHLLLPGGAVASFRHQKFSGDWITGGTRGSSEAWFVLVGLVGLEKP